MMQQGGKVDLARKEELILAKQIRQNTSKILQRPSYFHSSDLKKVQDKSWIRESKQQDKRISTPVMEALLIQKKEGKLASSALDDWLQNLEAQFDDHYEKCEKIENKMAPKKEKEEDVFWKNIKKDKVEVEFGTNQNEEEKEIKRKKFVDKFQAQLNEKRMKSDENPTEKGKPSIEFGTDESESDKEVKRKAWVNKFETQLNHCYSKREEGKKKKWLDNVETEFDRCLNECHAMEEFDQIDPKNDDLDMIVPISPLLDSSFAKHKADLNRRKSLTTGKKSKANCEEMASPRLNSREQRSNAARKHYEENVPKDSFVLGNEPDVVRTTQKKQSLFGMMYSSIDRKKRANPFYESLDRKKDGKNKKELEKEINKSRVTEHVLPEAPRRKKSETAKVKPYNPFVDDENVYEDVEYPQIKLRRNSEKDDDAKSNGVVVNSIKIEDTVEYIKTDIHASKSTSNKPERHYEPKEAKKPFKAVNDCLFSCYTSCIPWCIAKRFYWKTHS